MKWIMYWLAPEQIKKMNISDSAKQKMITRLSNLNSTLADNSADVDLRAMAYEYIELYIDCCSRARENYEAIIEILKNSN